jgi:hypothetical protein
MTVKKKKKKQRRGKTILVKRKPIFFDLDGNDVTERLKKFMPNNGEGSIFEIYEDEILEGDIIIHFKMS